MGKIYWSEVAESDLENIGNFIAKDAPIFAIEFIESLLAHTRNLSNFPLLGRIVPEFDNEELREVIYHNYRIVYTMKSKDIYVVSVTHSSMDLLNKSKKEKWELR